MCVCVCMCRYSSVQQTQQQADLLCSKQANHHTECIYDERKLCVRLPVAIVAVADVAADTDDGWDSDVDDADDMEFDNFELDESFLALVLFP